MNLDCSRDRMSRPPRNLWLAAGLWGLALSPLTGWGLPSRDADALLFGGPAWRPAEFGAAPRAELRRSRAAGADTDLDPLSRAQLLNLTLDHEARSAILLRYRLYSRQPDEMITFQALQRMDPRAGDFDPKLYQYGGAYIYLVGAVNGLAALFGYTQIHSDLSVYLAQPERFARFYVVGRLISLLFACGALVAAGRIAGRAGRGAAWAAMLLVAACPVFITQALEAKPHMPSTCMLLWAIERALAYQRGGRLRDALLVGLFGGFAFGFVLTGLAAAALWPALLILVREEPSAELGPQAPSPASHPGEPSIAGASSDAEVRRYSALQTAPVDRRRIAVELLLAGGLAIGVYVLTNPYVAYNLLMNRASLISNLSNSTAMYSLDRVLAGAARASQLTCESCGYAAPALGLVALVWLLRRGSAAALVAAGPGVALLLLCALIGAGKPAEFARFLLLPAALLCIATAMLAQQAWRRSAVLGATVLAASLGTMRTFPYLRSFAIDALGASESRRAAGEFLAKAAPPDDAIGLTQEPAPYATPPLDFANRRMWLLPDSAPPNEVELPRWLVLTADDRAAWAGAWWTPWYGLVARFPAGEWLFSRIAWANKPVYVFKLHAP